MNDASMRAMMIAIDTLRALPARSYPASVRFFRGYDEEDGGYRMCVARGPGSDEECAIVGGCLWTSGRIDLPGAVTAEGREWALSLFEASA